MSTSFKDTFISISLARTEPLGQTWLQRRLGNVVFISGAHTPN